MKPDLPVLSGLPVPKDPWVQPALQVQLGLPAHRDQLVKPVLPALRGLPAVCWAMQISTPSCPPTMLILSPPVKMSASPRTAPTVELASPVPVTAPLF